MKQLPSYEEAKAMAHNSNQSSSLWGRLGGAIIHLLGGFTKEECVQHNVEHYDLGCRNTADMFKRFADQMNGLPADEWCKMMYNHIIGYGKRLANENTEE